MKSYSAFILEAKKRISFTRVYHGGPKDAIENIKQSGHHNSEHGVYGPGVYASTSKNVARHYSRQSRTNPNQPVDSGVVSSLIPSHKVTTIRQSHPDSLEGREQSKQLRTTSPAVRIKNAAKGGETAKAGKGHEKEADYVVVDPKVFNKNIEKTKNKFRPTKTQKVTGRQRFGSALDDWTRENLKGEGDRPYVDRTKSRR